MSLQPFRLFAPDGVIMFADILTPLEGMGIPFRLDEGGPRITEPVRSPAYRVRLLLPARTGVQRPWPGPAQLAATEPGRR